jgi:hypothetical protein
MNRVNEQPLRRLDEMNEQQAYRFLAEPFEAPQWRALWVARMGTGAPPRDTRLAAGGASRLRSLDRAARRKSGDHARHTDRVTGNGKFLPCSPRSSEATLVVGATRNQDEEGW